MARDEGLDRLLGEEERFLRRDVGGLGAVHEGEVGDIGLGLELAETGLGGAVRGEFGDELSIGIGRGIHGVWSMVWWLKLRAVREVAGGWFGRDLLNAVVSGADA
jgi:hypothetical protein